MNYTRPKPEPLDNLEMFDLMRSCYPDQFPNDEDATYDAALAFADEFGGFDMLADLLGRVVLLTPTVQSPMTGEKYHCLGRAEQGENGVYIVAVAKRRVESGNPCDPQTAATRSTTP